MNVTREGYSEHQREEKTKSDIRVTSGLGIRRVVCAPAYLPDALAGVCLPQDPDLVPCAVSLSFHGLGA
jgi:hypothetical protein